MVNDLFLTILRIEIFITEDVFLIFEDNNLMFEHKHLYPTVFIYKSMEYIDFYSKQYSKKSHML